MEEQKRIVLKEPSTLEARVEARKQRSDVLERISVPDNEWIMYLQSLLVWNLPTHLASLLLAVYLVVSFVDALIVQRLNFFQLAGGLMVVAGVASFLLDRAARRRARAARAKTPPPSAPKSKAELERGLFWPQDAAGLSAETYPLSLKTLTARVKLYRHEQVEEMVNAAYQSALRALYALRILRYSNPTQFALNTCFVCFVAGVVGSFVSGRLLLTVILFSAILAPGVARRGIPLKLRRLLERRLGRDWADWLLVSNYLNLDETNTAKVVAFVQSTDAMGVKVPTVVTKPTA